MFRIAVSIGLVCALALLALNFYLDARDRAAIAGLEAEADDTQGRLRAAEAEAEAFGAAVIAPGTVERVKNGIFLVLRGGEPLGTAWLLDSKCGTFVTNAHVVDAARGKVETLTLRRSKDTADIPVLKTRAHVGYDAFTDLMDVYAPAYARDEDDRGSPLKLVHGYDAGILETKEACLEEADPALGAPLTIASEADLFSLKSGEPIFLIGFPIPGSVTEDVEDETLIPRVEVGSIRAVTSFIPSRARKAELDQLVLFSLETAPGTSGSPVFNAKGEVIALNQGISSRSRLFSQGPVFSERYAVRADVVREVAEGRDAERLETFYRAAWSDALSRYLTGEAWLARIAGQVMESRRNVKTVDDETITAVTETYVEAKTVEGYISELSFAAAQEAAPSAKPGASANAANDEEEDVDLYSIDDLELVYAMSFVVDPARTYYIRALDFDLPLGGPPCYMMVLRPYRKTGQLEIVAGGSGPTFIIRPGKANPGITNLFFAPARCSERNKHFQYVVASWRESEKPAPEASTSYFSIIRKRIERLFWTPR